MAIFPANPTRLDPYKNFKFRLKWDGKYVAGCSKVSPLKRMTKVVTHREGGDPSTSRKSPGPHRIRFHHARAGTDAGSGLSRLGGSGLELRFLAGLGGFARQLPQEHLSRVLQRGWATGDRVSDFPLLGIRIPGAPRPGRQRQCDCYRAHQIRVRRLAARYQRHRTAGTCAEHRQHVTCARFPMPISSTCGSGGPGCIPWTGGLWRSTPRSRRPARDLADWPLGRRNQALAELRCSCFGPRLEGWTACPRCAEKLEFQMDARTSCGALLASRRSDHQ